MAKAKKTKAKPKPKRKAKPKGSRSLTEAVDRLADTMLQTMPLGTVLGVGTGAALAKSPVPLPEQDPDAIQGQAAGAQFTGGTSGTPRRRKKAPKLDRAARAKMHAAAAASRARTRKR